MSYNFQEAARDNAQNLVWDAMDLLGRDNERAKSLCREALEIYPDCVDALVLIADFDSEFVKDFVPAMREAIEAGRRDLGQEFFDEARGMFWGMIETRPFMRAMARLVGTLIQWGTDERIDEAIEIQEEMLELNPNDNQGMRDSLAACYLQRKRYDAAADLLKRYENDGMAAALWARTLLAYATGGPTEATSPLAEAREQNPYVELYITGKKRRPRTRPEFYSWGDNNEAIFCADTLWQAWKKHPEFKRWIRESVTESSTT